MKFLNFKKIYVKLYIQKMLYQFKNLDDNPKIKELNEIADDDLILDIGPKTIDKIKDIIEKAKQFCGMVQQDILKILIFKKVVLKF